MPRGKQNEQAIIWQELEVSEGSISRYLTEEEAMSFWMCICKQVCCLPFLHLVSILIVFSFQNFSFMVEWDCLLQGLLQYLRHKLTRKQKQNLQDCLGEARKKIDSL